MHRFGRPPGLLGPLQEVDRTASRNSSGRHTLTGSDGLTALCAAALRAAALAGPAVGALVGHRLLSPVFGGALLLTAGAPAQRRASRTAARSPSDANPA
ncbi:hypothetical protein ACIRBZ_08475 [Streptomyces sp. NPDC094038]|uniref:hypothetical protein n=1 Tax=Streptomyces sp. NPDC094038 TaxID=3366055 RepID=UPI003821081A